jgi:hypothetical protein
MYLFVELMIVSIQNDINLCVQVCMHVHNDPIQYGFSVMLKKVPKYSNWSIGNASFTLII